jgi:hypothetical protein
MKNSMIIFIIFSFIYCDSPNDTNTEIKWPNHPPVIEDIVTFPGTRGIPYSCDLICVATDQDEDSLTYEWKSLSGYFHSMEGNMAYWAADTLGSYTVSCKVSDGNASDELNIVINVITYF